MLLPGAPMVRISIRCTSTRWLNYRCADVCHCGATTKLCWLWWCKSKKFGTVGKYPLELQWVNTPANR